MAISKAATQVKWSAANSVSVGSGANNTSDVVLIADAAIDGSLQIKADNAGTPVSGDELECYVLYSLGDPDADPDSVDEFDTYQHALPIVLDTNSEDPATKTIKIDCNAKSFKLHVRNQGASSMTVAAQFREMLNS